MALGLVEQTAHALTPGTTEGSALNLVHPGWPLGFGPLCSIINYAFQLGPERRVLRNESPHPHAVPGSSLPARCPAFWPPVRDDKTTHLLPAILSKSLCNRTSVLPRWSPDSTTTATPQDKNSSAAITL